LKAIAGRTGRFPESERRQGIEKGLLGVSQEATEEEAVFLLETERGSVMLGGGGMEKRPRTGTISVTTLRVG